LGRHIVEFGIELFKELLHLHDLNIFPAAGVVYRLTNAVSSCGLEISPTLGRALADAPCVPDFVFTRPFGGVAAIGVAPGSGVGVFELSIPEGVLNGVVDGVTFRGRAAEGISEGLSW
jgi:hypothetical protein